MAITQRVKQPALGVIQERKMKVPGLAYAAKMGETRVRHILYGYVYPTVEEMYLLASVLNTGIEDLFDENMRRVAHERELSRLGKR